MKKLYRSRSEKMIAGLFGGLGEYFEIDPTILRLLGVFIIIFTGIIPGLFVYIIAAVVMPRRPEVH